MSLYISELYLRYRFAPRAACLISFDFCCLTALFLHNWGRTSVYHFKGANFICAKRDLKYGD